MEGTLRRPHFSLVTVLLGPGLSQGVGFPPPPTTNLPAQPPSPHHVDGLRVTGKAEGIATGCGAEVDGHYHGEGGLLGGSGLRLLQVQDLVREQPEGQADCMWEPSQPLAVVQTGPGPPPPTCLPGFLPLLSSKLSP